MKKILSLSALFILMMSLQGCVAYVYGPVGYGPVVGWHHYHHGWWDASAQDPATLLSQNYGISLSSAQKITDFAAGNNTSQILSEMGVSASELAPLNDLQMPSQDTVQTIASNLGEEPSKIDQIFADFITDVKADNSESGNSNN